MPTRQAIADQITDRLTSQKAAAIDQYRAAQVPHFVIDDLLPADLAQEIAAAFPPVETMTLKSSLRERKYVTAQMNRCNALVEEAVFAFHDERVLSLVAEITGLQKMEADAMLYAGGISAMTRGHFLNPHLDNSHDRVRQRYRVLNLLYYTSPSWRAEDGGALELWPEGPRGSPISIDCRFNRLVVMATNRQSWHSVTPILGTVPRRCVSNYYFSPLSPEGEEYFHVTSFRGRPEQPIRDLVLRADIRLRMLLRKIKATGVVANPHYYQSPK